jgi:hypothetical protein
MPRLSLWKPNKSEDYYWIDRQIAEMYQVGGTGVGLHKYLGPINQSNTGDTTQPSYTTDSVTNIQDILFLENRDRKYDTDVYIMRGIYQRTDADFDLTQFGLFLQTGTIMMTFHYNEMIKVIGRKIMNGDVLELFHLKDNNVLDMPASLKRFYVVGDCSWATEGFSPTWYPHLWRCKLNPLVDSQEYKDILNNITVTDTSGPMGTPGITSPLVDIMSTYNKYSAINEAIVEQANNDVPESGYDVSTIYSLGSDVNGNTLRSDLTADDQIDKADNSTLTADTASFSPTPSQNPTGYLTGDGLAPNGLPVGAGVSFPTTSNLGDYFLRLDYLPNRLFRFNGSRWVKVEDNVRTNLTAGDPNNKTFRNSFANDSATYTLSNGDVVSERQSLSKALRPKADI